MSSRLILAALIAAVLGCHRAPDPPAEHLRLVDPPAGTLPLTYTLADETRPILAAPPEERRIVTVPADAGATVAFPLPNGAGGGTLVASGAYQRAKRVFPLLPSEVTVTDTAGAAPTATMDVPALARGSGPPTTINLTLTTPPANGVAETRTPPLAIPADATLHFGYALGEAAALAGAAPVRFAVVAEEEGRAPVELWSETITPKPFFLRWIDARASLAPVAGRTVSLAFRARADGPGRPIVVPIWGDPTIVAPGPRPRARRNVVLISLDTLRADRLGVDGSYRPTTPAIDAFAAHGAVFTNAWSVWPETSGAHMSLFSSRYPSEHGVTSFIQQPPPSLELLAERLRRAGYLTRAFTEDGGVWAYAGFARGFSAYAERRSADFTYRGEAVATFGDATKWLEANADRTFFLFVHTYQVHAPYLPPPDYRLLFADSPGRESPGEQEPARNYDRETRFTDDQVGPFLATLERLGIADDTIVLITADHGEEFGEHGGSGHGRTLYPEVLRVPWVLSAPGLVAPRRIDTPISILDVVPTLLDLLEVPSDAEHRGTSLVPLLRGEAPAPRTFFAEVDRMDPGRINLVSARRDGRAAIFDVATGVTRCYAASDLDEQKPEGSCPDLEAAIAEHRRVSLPIAAPNPRPSEAVDPRLIEKMRALGYVQ